ncbi:MAG: AGE family epimerase/isomerase, partial [Pseudomonadota bacterium]|nr:AGE family epimerase/isomerase [Pseudomonadota bacterium]
MALFDVTADDGVLDLARELVGLFRRHFFDAATGALGEFFTEDWLPAQGNAGAHVEPGHLYEWVWLLREYQDRTGEDLGAERAALYRFANAHGIDSATGLVFDLVDRDGTARRRSSRLWPQTEALRAHLVIGGEETEARAVQVVENMLRRYFAWNPRGTWMDQFGPDGEAIADKIPGSSFYHALGAYAELHRVIHGRGTELRPA